MLISFFDRLMYGIIKIWAKFFILFLFIVSPIALLIAVFKVINIKANEIVEQVCDISAGLEYSDEEINDAHEAHKQAMEER